MTKKMEAAKARKMKVKVLVCLCFAFLVSGVQGFGTTLTANLKNVLGGALTGNVSMKVRLRNFEPNVPRVIATGVVVKSEVDIKPDSVGQISSFLYSTYDITPAGTYYTIEYYAGGQFKSSANYLICTVTAGACSATIASFDLNSASPMTTVPVVAPPTGDTTYLRTDGGNAMAGNIVPNATGRNLGADAARWDAFLRNLDIGGGTLTGPAALSGTFAGGTFTGGTFSGATLNAKTLNSTRFADNFAGSDCGAKVNTADADLGATAGEIWVNQNCGTTWTTALVMSANHVLRFVQGGTYTLNVGQTISAANVGVVGDGPWTTVLSINFAAGDVFHFTGSGGYVRDVRFVAAVARTAGAYVHFQGIMPGLTQNFSTDGAYMGVEITDSSIVRVQNGVMRNGATTGGAGEIMLDGTGGQNDIFIDNVTMDAPGGSQPPTGIGVYNSGATNITNVDIIHHGTDLAVAPGNGQYVASLYALNSFFDTAVNGIVIAPTGTGNVDRVRIADSWTSSHSNVGIMLNNAGAGSCGAIMIVGHHSILNASHGLQNNQGCIDVQISGGVYADNGGNGIVVGANATAFQIQGVRSGNGGGIAGNAQYGISINAGASDNYQIIGNDLRGNTIGALVDGGTGLNKVISGNLPFSTTDNSGKSLVAGYCSGTATASSTLGLFPVGTLTTTCSSNVTSIGAVLPSNAIVRNLYIRAITGGKNASSGVFTVMKNTGATALTCTLGTGTVCSDTTHAASFVAGDVLTIQFTTQGSETLANIQASVER